MGNLTGTSRPSPPLTKKASVLGALTWRHHAAIARGETVGAARSELLPVLLEDTDGSEGLKGLVVELEPGQECAFEYIREGLLVGTLGGRSPQAQQAYDIEEVEDSEDMEPRNGASEQQQQPREPDEERQRRIKALLLKADAMAEYLRDELKDFMMPADLE